MEAYAAGFKVRRQRASPRATTRYRQQHGIGIGRGRTTGAMEARSAPCRRASEWCTCDNGVLRLD